MAPVKSSRTRGIVLGMAGSRTRLGQRAYTSTTASRLVVKVEVEVEAVGRRSIRKKPCTTISHMYIDLWEGIATASGE
jgi:hypothetical protein